MSDYQMNTENQPKRLKAKLSTYITGFILSIICTLIAFSVVQTHAFAPQALYLSVVALGVLQLVIQIFCFLRLNTSAEEGRWNLVTLLFTLIVVAIVVTGSLWIMYNLNYNMVSH